MEVEVGVTTRELRNMLRELLFSKRKIKIVLILNLAE